MGRFTPSLVPFRPGSLGLALALLVAVPGFPGEPPAEPNRVAMALGRDATNSNRSASPAAAPVDDVFELFKVRRSVLGVPVKWPEPPPKKPLDSFVVFEGFGKQVASGSGAGLSKP